MGKDIPIARDNGIELINTEAPNPRRKLAYMFFELPYHKRIKIASELDLIDDSDKNLNSISATQKYFRKAVDQDSLKELWDKVANLNPEISKESNPFKD